MSNNLKYKKNKGTKSNIPYYIFTIIITFLSLLGTTLVLSFISLKFKNPVRFSDAFSILSIIISGLVCSVVSYFFNPNRNVLISLISTVFISTVLILFGTLQDTFNFKLLINYAVLVLESSVISLLLKGSNSKKRVKKYLN